MRKSHLSVSSALLTHNCALELIVHSQKVTVSNLCDYVRAATTLIRSMRACMVGPLTISLGLGLAIVYCDSDTHCSSRAQDPAVTCRIDRRQLLATRPLHASYLWVNTEEGFLLTLVSTLQRFPLARVLASTLAASFSKRKEANKPHPLQRPVSWLIVGRVAGGEERPIFWPTAPKNLRTKFW